MSRAATRRLTAFQREVVRHHYHIHCQTCREYEERPLDFALFVREWLAVQKIEEKEEHIDLTACLRDRRHYPYGSEIEFQVMPADERES